MSDDELLTLTEAAQIAPVGARALAYAIDRGDLPGLKKGKTWLIKRADLDQWVRDHDKHKPGLEPGQKINRKPRKQSTE